MGPALLRRRISTPSGLFGPARATAIFAASAENRNADKRQGARRAALGRTPNKVSAAKSGATTLKTRDWALRFGGKLRAMSAPARTIVHVDLDAFYASVEQRDNPDLRGKPVVVGGTGRRGVVCAASYEARPFGVRSAMSMAEARQRCPEALIVAPRMTHYAEVSSAFFEILNRFTPEVEGLSLDEAFLDVTAVRTLFGNGHTIAQAIKKTVRDELNLVASVGVAPSKFVAKIGSDLKKPDGLVVVDAEDVLKFLHPLPAARLWGVGRKNSRALGSLGVSTIADVARTPVELLCARLGTAMGQHLHALAQGLDPRPVKPRAVPASIGHENTFEADVDDREHLRLFVLDQSDRVATRLRKKRLKGRTVTVKVKYADHGLVSRQFTRPVPTDVGAEIAEDALRLLGEVPSVEARGVRLTGVAVGGLSGDDGALVPSRTAQQLSFDQLLTASPPKNAQPAGESPLSRATGSDIGRIRRMESAVDQVRARFGSAALQRGALLERRPVSKPNDGKA